MVDAIEPLIDANSFLNDPLTARSVAVALSKAVIVI
jgi:hypothetical protein